MRGGGREDKAPEVGVLLLLLSPMLKQEAEGQITPSRM